MHFKNTDVRWGAGEGRLTSLKVDENFYEVDQRLLAIEGDPPEAVSVDNVTATATTVTFHLSDGSTRGPFTLPAAKFTMTGPWVPLHVYPAGVLFSEGGDTYLVEYPHTSAATFDPGANDGLGHNYYSLLPFPHAPVLEWLDDGWPPTTVLPAFKVFSVPDVGVFMSLLDHTTAATFDPDAVDGLSRPLYQKLFGAIETNIARIQFQYPGKPPSDESLILKYLNDDTRDLVFATDFPGSTAHLEDASAVGTLVYTILVAGVEVGTFTFTPGSLLDGDGGQFAAFEGTGATIPSLDLLRVTAPDTADAAAKFLTLSLVGSYAA